MRFDVKAGRWGTALEVPRSITLRMPGGDLVCAQRATLTVAFAGDPPPVRLQVWFERDAAARLCRASDLLPFAEDLLGPRTKDALYRFWFSAGGELAGFVQQRVRTGMRLERAVITIGPRHFPCAFDLEGYHFDDMVPVFVSASSPDSDGGQVMETEPKT